MKERRECTASFEVLIAVLAGRFVARSAPEPEQIKVAEVEYRVTTEEDFGMDRLSTTSEVYGDLGMEAKRRIQQQLVNFVKQQATRVQ